MSVRAAKGINMPLSYLLFSFKGRISRQTYWFFTFALMAIILAPVFIFGAVSGNAELYVDMTSLIFLWPTLAVQAKRWHDRDKSAWWILISLIPVIGFFWTLVENGFLEGTPGSNRFGPNPIQAPMDERSNNPRKTLKGKSNQTRNSPDKTVPDQDPAKKRLGWKKVLLVTAAVIVFLGVGLVTGILPFAVATVGCGRLPVIASNFAASYSYQLPEDPRYGPNPLDRVYFCSKEAAESAGYRHVAFPL